MELQEEIEHARSLAPSYVLLQSNPLRQLISRTTHDAFAGRRSVEGFLEFMGALIKDETGVFRNHSIDIRLLFINSLKSKDVQVEALSELKLDDNAAARLATRKANINAMVKGAVDKGILTIADAKINFSTQLLQDNALIPSKIMFDRRLVRLNTSMLYKQNKFNLFREDNVGYAALINDLIVGSIDLPYDEYGQAPPTPIDRIPSFLQTVSSHIGIFHLDPNRVLDVLLDFYIKELLRNFSFWIALFKQSKWIEANHASLIMAHLLGYKFEYYQNYEVKNSPSELYYGCAILIKQGLVRLYDLLPYLKPNEAEMEAAKKSYLEHMNKEMKTLNAGGLSMYGALGEEGVAEILERPAPKVADDDDGEHSDYTANDVVELTKALLAVGDIYHAEQMFAKYEKLLDMHPEIAHHIYRLCDVILQPAYERYVPDAIKEKYVLFAQAAEDSKIKSEFGNTVPKMERVLVTDYMKEGCHDRSKKKCYTFFYQDWNQDLPRCETFEDLVKVFAPVMRMAGYKTYLAPNLIQKLLLIVRSIIERQNEYPDAKPYCMAIVREFLLPAVSFSNTNPGTMASVWELLDLLPYQERCALYGEWGNDFYKKTIETKLLKARTILSIKHCIRRVSRIDVRKGGRDLGKLSNSNPMLVFNVMLDTIQFMDNLAPYMADACRYMGDFAYDVLSYLLTEKWTGSQGPGRMKRKKVTEIEDVAVWIRALATFTGMLYKKQGVDPAPLIKYMIHRLRHNDSVDDLVLFNEFITKLGGIELINDALTDHQVISSASSETVRSEAFQPLSSDNRRASKRVLSRLKEALKADNAALELVVLLYRLKESFGQEKVVMAQKLGKKIDFVQRTIMQFMELLTQIFEPPEYATLFPSAVTLVKEYDLPESLVMQLIRPITRYNLHTYQGPEPSPDEPHPAFKSLIEQVPQFISDPSVLNIITAEFYVIFWQLSLYDIQVPEEHYLSSMRRHKNMIAQCQDTRSEFYTSNRPSVVSKTERQSQSSLEALQQDLPKHKKEVEHVMEVLKASQARWFPTDADRLPLISSIIQYCLLPRSIASEVDAVFCSEFVLLMHRLGVKNFSSLTILDKVLSEHLPTAVLSFTEYETTIHARFIYHIFAKMSEWHKDEQVYLKGAHGDGLIGFQKKWNVQSSSQEVAKEDLLSYQEFKRVTHKWHLKTSLAIEQALLSGEENQIRNAFLILRQFVPYFPIIREHGQVLVKATLELANRGDKDKLSILARSYRAYVEKGRSRWITKNAFLGIEEPEPEPAPRTEKLTATTTTTTTAATTTRSKSTSPPHNDKRDSSSDRKRSRDEQSSHANGSKRVRHEDEDRSKRDSSGNRHRSAPTTPTARERESARESSTRDSGRGEGTTRESARDSPRESTRQAARDSPREPGRVRDHARDAIREAARDSARAPPKELSARDSRGANNGGSAAASRKRERTEDERDRDRADKRYSREDRREERRDRDRERDRERNRDRNDRDTRDRTRDDRNDRDRRHRRR
ncbi:transcription factor/nuclear export subunit protein 2-domain-containing protein [Fennellomyces sp. T-0311]|nr:transcription factor/nuclear export subunit protein 2-domain-containing protein [Fennellomyces sp. T-0311]